jgi:hypothetical protein
MVKVGISETKRDLYSHLSDQAQPATSMALCLQLVNNCLLFRAMRSDQRGLHRPKPTSTEEVTQSYDGGRSFSGTEGLRLTLALEKNGINLTFHSPSPIPLLPAPTLSAGKYKVSGGELKVSR